MPKWHNRLGFTFYFPFSPIFSLFFSLFFSFAGRLLVSFRWGTFFGKPSGEKRCRRVVEKDFHRNFWVSLAIVFCLFGASAPWLTGSDLCFQQKNTRLKKYGFHTERFSYIVLRKGQRDPVGKWTGSLQQRVAPLLGPVTVPPSVRDRPPHGGLRPLIFSNRGWVP